MRVDGLLNSAELVTPHARGESWRLTQAPCHSRPRLRGGKLQQESISAGWAVDSGFVTPAKAGIQIVHDYSEAKNPLPRPLTSLAEGRLGGILRIFFVVITVSKIEDAMKGRHSMEVGIHLCRLVG